MAVRPFNDVINEVKGFIDANPGLFNGVAPANVIPHLGTVHPNLWNQLNEAYREQGGQGFSNNIKTGMIAGSILPGVGNAIGAGVGAGMDFTAAGAPTLNEWALHNPAFGQTLIGQAPAPKPVAPQLPQQPAGLDQEQIQAEALKRSDADLQKKLDAIFGQQEQLGTEAIDRSFAPQRSKVASELAASGNLTSPISRYGLDELDRQKSLAMGQLFGNLGSQRAAGQLDTSKTIESILAGERRAKESGDQFSQSLQFGRDKLLSDINTSNEQNGLNRYLQDQKLRVARDSSEPDEWTKQLGRINGVLDTTNKTAKTGGDLAYLFGF